MSSPWEHYSSAPLWELTSQDSMGLFGGPVWAPEVTERKRAFPGCMPVPRQPWSEPQGWGCNQRVSSELSATCPANPTGEDKMGWPTHVCIWKCSRRSYLTLMMAETSVEQNWVSAVNETFFALHLFLFIYLTKIYGEPPISCIITSCIGVILLMINIWKEMLPYDKIRNQQLPVSQGSDCRGMGRGCDREDHTPHSSRCAL